MGITAILGETVRTEITRGRDLAPPSEGFVPPARGRPSCLEALGLGPTRSGALPRPGVPSHSHCPAGSVAGGSRAGFCG